MENDDLIAEAKRIFKLAEEVEHDNRESARDDIEFALLSKQWDDDAIKARRLKGKPMLTINKLPSHIRQVVNDARQNKPSIKINPVDSNSDIDTAEVLTGLIRNIENTSKADLAYDTGIFQSISSGYGYWRVNIDFTYDDTFDKDIIIDRIANQFSVYGDPYSTSADGSDWNHCFVTETITKKEFADKYKGKSDSSNWEVSDGYDKLEGPWVEEDGVMIAEYWCREVMDREICLLSNGDVVDEDVYQDNADAFMLVGIQKVDQRTTKSYKVIQYIMSGAEILEENEWPGKYIPIVPCYGEEIFCDGERTLKSLIRDSKDAQRQFNFWRTKSTEHAAKSTNAPWIGKVGTFSTEAHKWAQANNEDFAYIQYDKDPPVQTPPPMANAAALQEAMNSADDIQSTMGMFNPSLGAVSNEISGKAIIARQRESDTGSFHFVDNLSRAIRHTGCIIVDLIPHIYSGERVIRVLGEDKKESKSVMVAQGGGEQIDSETGEITRIYDLTTGKYDVVVSSGTSYATQRQEAAAQMIEMMRVNPQAGQIMMDLLAKNLDWPGADEISERFKSMLPPQIQGENPQVQQLQQMLQQTQQQAQQIVSQLQQKIAELSAEKQIDIDKVQIDAYNAETNRLKTVQTGMTQEQVQALIVQTIMQLQTPGMIDGTQQPQGFTQ